MKATPKPEYSYFRVEQGHFLEIQITPVSIAATTTLWKINKYKSTRICPQTWTGSSFSVQVNSFPL